MIKITTEHPECEYYKPVGGLQKYAMEVWANVCTENIPYSCKRSQEEGLCKNKKVTNNV